MLEPTADDPQAPDGAKSGFLLARVGYVWSLLDGPGVGGHLFGRFYWSRSESWSRRATPSGVQLSVSYTAGVPFCSLLFCPFCSVLFHDAIPAHAVARRRI